MTYNPAQHHRRSVRLSGYDYTQPGAYFVTIVTQGRECLLGDVLDGKVRLNRAGQVAQREWERLPRRFPRVQLDAFVVMPNHIHGIIIITDHAGRGTAGCTDTTAVDGSAVPLREPTAAPHRTTTVADDTRSTAGCTDTTAVDGSAVPLQEPTAAPHRTTTVADDTRSTAGCTDTTAAGGPAVPLPPNHSAAGGGATGDDTAAWVGRTDCTDAVAAGGPAVPLPEPTATPPREQFGRPVPGSIPTMVRSYKSAATLRINLVRGTPGASVWQRNYYEHVVRNEASLNRIREYIADNPARWDDDDENPKGARR